MPAEPRIYTVVATRRHLDAMAQAASGVRDWGPLALLGLPAGAYLGFALTAWLLPPPLRAAQAAGWLAVLTGAVLGAWLVGRYLAWAVRARVRKLLTSRGWHEGSVHEAVFDDEGFTLRGPTSEVRQPYAGIRSFEQRHGGVLVRRHGSRGLAVISVDDLFPVGETRAIRQRMEEAGNHR